MDKAEILREIKRTAAANGGMPLGSRRFTTETGIREAEWLGKLWARWNDALREAGFAPNQLQGAFDTAELMEYYAKLAQELGRLPTANDVRLKDHSNPDFPNAKVFERLGTKAQLVGMLAEFCHKRENYADLIPLCEAYTASNGSPSNGTAQKEQLGFVYLLKSGRFYKIGKTNAVGRREYELAIQLPERAATAHVIRTDDPDGIEEYWHKRFAPKRRNGEWFDLDARDVAAFKSRKFM